MLERLNDQVSINRMTATDGQPQIDLRGLNAHVIGAVYDQYFSEVYRYALYRVGETTLAEDISSEVFIRLLEAVQAGHGPDSNLRGWLIGTANHIVTDQMRKKYRRSEEEISESLPDLNPGPVSEVDQREQNRSIQNAYLKLTPEQQHVLALRFGQGYSLEETATQLNKNVNAVKALQFRALAALQREIGEVNDE